MRWFRQSTVEIVGDLLLVLPFILRLVEWVLELRIVRIGLGMANLGQAVDFTIQHLENPGWIGNGWVQIAAITVGLTLIFWDRKRPWWLPSPELSSRQMIISGLVIIIFGVTIVAIGLWQAPENPPVTTQAAGTTPPTKPQRKYSSADVPKLTPIVQRISEIVTSEGAPLAFEIANYCGTLQQKLNASGTQETISQLQSLADRANKFGTEIDDIQNRAGYYQNEVNYIIDAKNGNLAQGVAQEIKNVTRWMTGIASPPNPAGFEILQNMDFQLQSKVRDFQKWAADTPRRIQEIRSDLDAATDQTVTALLPGDAQRINEALVNIYGIIRDKIHSPFETYRGILRSINEDQEWPGGWKAVLGDLTKSATALDGAEKQINAVIHDNSYYEKDLREVVKLNGLDGVRSDLGELISLIKGVAEVYPSMDGKIAGIFGPQINKFSANIEKYNWPEETLRKIEAEQQKLRAR